MPLSDLDLKGWPETRYEMTFKYLRELPLTRLDLSNIDYLKDDTLQLLSGMALTNLNLGGCRELLGSGLRYRPEPLLLDQIYPNLVPVFRYTRGKEELFACLPIISFAQGMGNKMKLHPFRLGKFSSLSLLHFGQIPLLGCHFLALLAKKA